LADRQFIRELREETALTVTQAERVGSVILNTAILPVPLDLYIAWVTGTPAAQTSEAIRDVRFFSPATIRKMVTQNEICCGVTLALLAHALVRGLLP